MQRGSKATSRSLVLPGHPSHWGGAVYLFTGLDATPDDIDGLDADPHATTRVVIDPISGQVSYALRFLEAGEYTLAGTCLGDTDLVDADDDLQFQSITDAEPGDGEVLRVDLVNATAR